VSRGDVVVDDNFRADIMQGLEGVTQNSCVLTPDVGFCRTGTAYSAFKGYDYKANPIYGKTGTAQDKDKFDWKDTSLFSAFSIPPGADAPQFQVTAIIEQAGFGSGSAAPTVRCMFEKLANPSALAPVKQSDELNRNQFKAAVLPPLDPADAECLHVQDDDIRQAAIGKALGKGD
jgi:penicillin-binding protein 2